MGNGVLNSLLGNMLGSVLMQNLRGQMTIANVGDGDAEDEVSSMEDLVKRAMATEMFDIMRAYNVFKVKYFPQEIAIKYIVEGKGVMVL